MDKLSKQQEIQKIDTEEIALERYMRTIETMIEKQQQIQTKERMEDKRQERDRNTPRDRGNQTDSRQKEKDRNTGG